MVKLLAQIKGSDKQKTTIRQTLEKDLSRLKADINLLLGDAFVKLRKKFPQYKGLLIIFDNMDRVPPTIAEHLFFDYAAQLQELDCTIIYTVPISVLCSPKNPLNQFDGNPHIVPMVTIYEF
ncbi:MAG: ATP-binding protein, partial [Nostoc sp.]